MAHAEEREGREHADEADQIQCYQDCQESKFDDAKETSINRPVSIDRGLRLMLMNKKMRHVSRNKKPTTSFILAARTISSSS